MSIPIDPSHLFALTGQALPVLWLLLVASLFVRRLQPVVRWLGFVILPLVMGTLYVLAMWPHVPFESGGFGSLGQLRVLFADDDLLLAGWLHFLVFDYFIGTWIAEDRRKQEAPRLLVIPCLALCFLAGPAGLLAYLLLKGGTLMVRSAWSVRA